MVDEGVDVWGGINVVKSGPWWTVWCDCCWWWVTWWWFMLEPLSKFSYDSTFIIFGERSMFALTLTGSCWGLSNWLLLISRINLGELRLTADILPHTHNTLNSSVALDLHNRLDANWSQFHPVVNYAQIIRLIFSLQDTQKRSRQRRRHSRLFDFPQKRARRHFLCVQSSK